MKSKRFIIITKSSTKDEDENIVNFVKENKMSWWHWLDNYWLFIDHSNKHNPRSIADVFTKIYPNKQFLIQEIDLNSWYGQLPIKPNNAFDWLNDNWTKDV